MTRLGFTVLDEFDMGVYAQFLCSRAYKGASTQSLMGLSLLFSIS